MRKFVFIEKLPSGNYSVRHWVGTKFEREWFSDYGLAKHRAADLELKLLALKQGQTDPTLKPIDLYNKYIESIKHTHRPDTLRLKDSHAKPFFAISQHFTVGRIKEYKAEQLKKNSITTVSIRLREIRAVANWAKKEGYINEELFENIEIPASKEGGRKLELTEVKQLFSVADAEFRPFLGFLVFTGARYSEILKAEWHEIDLDKGVWHIPAHKCKTNKERFVPLEPVLVSMLQLIFKHKGLVFEGWAINTARWYIKKACKKLQWPVEQWPSPHTFRHTFASHWRGDTRKLQDMLGWTTGAMLKRYSHFTVEDLREEAGSKGIAGQLQI